MTLDKYNFGVPLNNSLAVLLKVTTLTTDSKILITVKNSTKMEKQKITIHRALSELKVIDARIEKAIADFQPVAGIQKNKKIMGYLTQSEFSEAAQSGYDSIHALINRKAAIKSAVVASNAVTQVVVGRSTFTVADAITFKKLIESKQKFVAITKAKFTQLTGNINKANEAMQKNADVLLQNALGTEYGKADKSTVSNIVDPYTENNIVSLVDPLKIEEKIKQMEAEIQTFTTDIDAVLSESNAVTFVEV